MASIFDPAYRAEIRQRHYDTNTAAVAERDAPLRGDRLRRRRRRPQTILGDVMAQTSIAVQTLLGA